MTKSTRLEHGYDEQYSITVLGDWNSQDPKFLYYESTVRYQKSLDYQKEKDESRIFIYFGAVNYQEDVT